MMIDILLARAAWDVEHGSDVIIVPEFDGIPQAGDSDDGESDPLGLGGGIDSE